MKYFNLIIIVSVIIGMNILLNNNSLAQSVSNDTYITRATEAFNNKNYPETIKILDEALLKNSINYKYYYLRGDAKQLNKDYQGAINDYSQALYYNPQKMSPQKIAQKYAGQRNKTYANNQMPVMPARVSQNIATKIMGGNISTQNINQLNEALNQSNYKYEAPLYYKRGLSKIGLNQKVDAAEDLNTARKMYQALNDTNQVNIINNKLKELKIKIN
ncbi:MAG: hypothetical protein AB7V50_03340 [Vampirovibrionia bacterium]